MATKFLLEDGVSITRFRQSKLLENYESKGVVTLDEGLFVKTIQCLPCGFDDNGREEHNTIIVIGKRNAQ